MGGSDQWGKHSFGKELIWRMLGQRGKHHLSAAHHVLGKKFGKTEEGAVWFERCPPPAPTRCTNTGSRRPMRMWFAPQALYLPRSRAHRSTRNETQCRPEAREAQRVLAAELHDDRSRSRDGARRGSGTGSVLGVDEVPTHETIPCCHESAGDGDYASGSRYGIGLVDLMIRTRWPEKQGCGAQADRRWRRLSQPIERQMQAPKDDHG